MDRDKIVSEAIDRVAYRVAQSVQAAITHLEHAKMQLGYPGTIPITESIDGEGGSLSSTMMAALMDSLPLSPRVAVVHADGGDALQVEEIELLAEEVYEEVLKLFNGDGDE